MLIRSTYFYVATSTAGDCRQSPWSMVDGWSSVECQEVGGGGRRRQAKDTKTFWIPKIRKPFISKRYENLSDPRSRSSLLRKLLDPKDTKTFWISRSLLAGRKTTSVLRSKSQHVEDISIPKYTWKMGPAGGLPTENIPIPRVDFTFHSA
jgi:hypothetical protein